MTATYDEKKHPRHPKGTAEGGEFRRVTALPTLQEAATRERERNLENLPKGFPPGAFAPEDSVKFWPLRMGGFNALVPTGPHGPFWKAITDPHTGDELAFWFVDAAGYPHHTSMAQALGLRTNFVPISGYGTVSDAAAFPDGSPSSERAHEIPERHRRDLRDANAMLPENEQDRALAAAAWDESKHSRHPAGSPEGGEFAPNDLAPNNPTVARDALARLLHSTGSFEPDEKVKFWPTQIGTYRGEPLWKGLVDKDGKEIAFWFVDEWGNPHHEHMASALNQREWGMGRLVGNGDQPDADWLRGQEERIDQSRAMAERHRRDINDAREILMGEKERRRALVEERRRVRMGQPVAASAWEEANPELAPAFEKLQRQYEKVYRRAARRAVAAYREANKVLTAAVTPQPDEIVNPVAILESFMRLTGLARRGLLLEILNTLRTAYGMEQVDAGDEQPDQALSIYLDLLQEQAGVQAERLVAGAQDAAASVMLESLAEGWSVPQTAKALKVKMESIAPWQATMLARTDLIALGNGASVQRAVVLNDPQLQYKTWLATPDERTRLNHRHAHGQTVPVNQAFTVAGEQLQYPGDPSASDGNVINCRCTVVYGADPLGPEGVRQIAMLPDLAVSAAGYDTPEARQQRLEQRHRAAQAKLRAGWDEAKHPRQPAGTEKGGEFASRWHTMTYPATDFDVPDLDELKDEVATWPEQEGSEGHYQREAKKEATAAIEEAESALGLQMDITHLITTRDQEGLLSGVGSFEDDEGYPDLLLGHFGATANAGLPLFAKAIDEAASRGKGLQFTAGNARAQRLYERLGLPKEFPEEPDYASRFRVPPDVTAELARDLFVLARQKNIQASAWEGALVSAAWDESKHHREPAGTEKGGEFARDVRGGRLQAEIERQRAAQGRNPSGFPPGEFVPDDPKVKFWPNQMGGYKYADRPGAPSGPFWKALYDPRSDTELAFWFVDKHGLPNHAPMQRALGQIPSDRTWFTYSGYGMVGDSMRRGRPQRSTIEEDIVNRHRRDIRDANAMLPESQQDRALAAAAWDETKHPREPGGTREGGRFADKGTPGDVYYGARMVVEDGKSVGYQAFRMQRMISQHKGVRLPGIRTDAGPVRETYEEARDDAIAARDAPSAPPLAAAASANAVLEMQRTRARERATGARLFDEAKHPRHPKGTPEGGEFREKGSIAAQPTVDETRARQDFEAWAAGVEPYYEDKQQFADAKNWLWGRYEESVGRSLPALRSRLEKAGVPGVTIFPQGDKGDWDVLADPEATHSADYQVQLPSDGDALPPDFTVWTYEDGTVEVEDVLDIGDKDFFPNGPESPTAQNYAKLVDAARGLPLEGQDESFVTIYRGMSDKEFNAWEAGDPIPAGKFFTDQPTVQYAMDKDREPPTLRAFRVPRSMVVQTGANEFQLRQTGAMKSGRIEPAAQFQPPFRSGRQWREPVSASGVPYTGNGGMIALYPEPDEAEAIARERGQEPEDLHLTLLFYPDGVPGHAAAVIKDMGYEGLKGEITGIGRFKAGEDGAPVVGIVSAVGLNELRAKLAERLPGYSEKFGFVPHITLGYDQTDDDPADESSVKDALGAVGLPVTFRAVTVKDGGERQDVVTAAGWEEAKHPREPVGSAKGGQFALLRQYSHSMPHGYENGIEDTRLDPWVVHSLEINEYLRGQADPFPGETEQEVAGLDQVFRERAIRADEPLILWRGQRVEPGDYTDPGYVSATFNREVAEEFTQPFGEDEPPEEVVAIWLPKGTPFIPVAASGRRFQEILLPRGGSFEEAGTTGGHRTFKYRAPNLTAAGWDESAHPRWPAGSEHGGEFAPKGTVATEAMTEAVIGPREHGGYRIPATGNLKQHLIKVAELEMGDILGSWPELSAEQAERLKAFIEREYADGLLASNRTPGSARREARWVMKEFGEPEFGARAKKGAPPAPVEALPPTGNVRGVLDKLAIGGGRNSDLVLEAVRTIDQTMHYPKVAGEQELKIKMTSGRGSRQAALWRSQSTMEPQKITVSSNGQNVISSSVHEMGHYLDSLLGQDRRPYEGPALYWEDYSSKQHDGTLRPVIAAIKETDMYQRLARAESGAFGRNTAGVFEYGGRRFAAGQKHIRYLMQPPELLARSFEQYIAQKNPKSRLAGTMRHAFNVGGQAFLMPPEYPGYMQGQDLVNVNNAWERVLRERGLLKKQGFEEPPPPKTEAAVREAARRKALDATVRDLATPAPRPISEEERRRREVMGEIARILK